VSYDRDKGGGGRLAGLREDEKKSSGSELLGQAAGLGRNRRGKGALNYLF